MAALLRFLLMRTSLLFAHWRICWRCRGVLCHSGYANFPKLTRSSSKSVRSTQSSVHLWVSPLLKTKPGRSNCKRCNRNGLKSNNERLESRRRLMQRIIMGMSWYRFRMVVGKIMKMVGLRLRVMMIRNDDNNDFLLLFVKHFDCFWGYIQC